MHLDRGLGLYKFLFGLSEFQCSHLAIGTSLTLFRDTLRLKDRPSMSLGTRGAFGEWKLRLVLLLLSVELARCLMNTQFYSLWQDATQESIPIMLVGNKADLRDAAAAEGQKCVPGYFGEKLAMVRVKVGLLG